MYKQYFVIDAHCHVYPDAIAEKAVHGTSTFYDIEFALNGTVQTLERVCAESGVDQCLIQSVATSPKQVASINRFIARTAEDSHGKLVGLGTLHPDSEDMDGDVKTLLDLGLRGVKLHPDIQRFSLTDRRCGRIYELCSEYHLPLLLHTGDKRYAYSNPDQLIPVLKEYPGCTVIGAHLGGYSVWQEACEKLQGFDNLYFDCSSSFPFIGPEKAREIILKYGCERVLFGTDYPMWRPDTELETFFQMSLSENENRMILSENAQRLFQISFTNRLYY